MTTKDEVIKALTEPGAKVVNLRRMYDGAQSEVVTLPATTAKRHYTAGRLRQSKANRATEQVLQVYKFRPHGEELHGG